MKINSENILRNTLPLAVIAVAVPMLILSACGGGGGDRAGIGNPVVLTQMGGTRQGVALSLTPTVSTFAGLALTNTNADGTGGAASFNAPLASVSDGTNLYIADSANNTIRKVVIATGVVTTLAGSSAVAAGSLDATGTAATFNAPSGITISPDFTNLYVADTGNNSIRRVSLPGAVVTTLAGLGSLNAGSTDGLGNTAKFNSPYGITTDGNKLYIADTYSHKIREIAASGVGVTLVNMSSSTAAVSTLAGTGGFGTTNGAGGSAKFNIPTGITTDGLNLYVADYGNNRIRKIAPSGALSNITSATATVSTFAGAGAGISEGTGTGAKFSGPTSITTDGVNIYVADNGNNKIRKITVSGAVTSSLTGAADTAGAIGYVDGTVSSASFGIQVPNNGLFGISISPDGKSLYVMDSDNNTIRKITADNAVTLSTMTSATVSTLAGVAALNRPVDGTGMAARLEAPRYSTTDGTNLYVTDCGNNAEVRKVVIATGVVTTLAGSSTKSSVDGTGTATFTCPKGITTDGTNLYVVDNNTVRVIAPVGSALSAMNSANAAVTTMVPSGLTLVAAAGITTDGTSLFVADGSSVVRIAAPSGAMLSSMNAASGVASTIGAGTLAATGITTDGKNLFVSDNANAQNNIVKIAPPTGVSLSGMLAASAVASPLSTATTGGGATEGAGTVALFLAPSDITTDGVNLYVVDKGNNKIRMIAPAGGATLANISAASSVVSSITGGSGVQVTPGGYADGAGSSSTLDGPTGITTDGVSLYVTDSSNGTIRKIR